MLVIFSKIFAQVFASILVLNKLLFEFYYDNWELKYSLFLILSNANSLILIYQNYICTNRYKYKKRNILLFNI